MTTRIPAIIASAALTVSMTACSSQAPVVDDHTLTQIPETQMARGGIAPGDPIAVHNADGTYSRCTAGLNTDSQGHQGILVAGHCGSPGDPVFIQGEGGHWTQVSRVARSVYDPDSGIDAAFIPISGGQGSQHVRAASVTRGAGLTRGMRVCAAGATSGYRCGPVLTVAKNRVVADFPSRHGDSGGPVWADGQEVGIVTAMAAEGSDKTVVFPIGAAMKAVGASLAR